MRRRQEFMCVLPQLLAATLIVAVFGCTTIKRSDTARTGLEQLLISSAVDHALNRIDWSPIRGAPVYVETKYLDCVDKNYIILSVHQRLLANGCTLMDKAKTPPSPSSSQRRRRHRSPRLLRRHPRNLDAPPRKSRFPSSPSSPAKRPTARLKLAILAYDTKSKHPVISTGTLAAPTTPTGAFLAPAPSSPAASPPKSKPPPTKPTG